MRRAFIVVVWLLLQLVPAAADFESSKAWFDRLSADERLAAQTDLVLLGHYKYLIDGQFGRGTYEALTAFQRAQGRAETGVLSRQEREALSDLGRRVDQDLGMELVVDDRAQVEIVLPRALLTERADAPLGYTYSNRDEDISVETLSADLAGQSFRALYALLSEPEPGDEITYKTYSDDRFVVAGTNAGYSFYVLLANAGAQAVGFALSWSRTHAAEGEMLSVFLASHVSPLAALGDAPTTKAAVSEPPDRRGAFRLPADRPDVIELSADITGTTPDDFLAALADRPGVRIVLLNSPGGSVYSALLMAHEIKDRGLATYVPKGMGCYSACAYMFFAGADRQAEGELGVHQIYSDVIDVVMAQTTLGDILDALEEFGVEQPVISHMLRTPPQEMYVFTRDEIADYGINRGGPIEVAVADGPIDVPEVDADRPADAGVAAFVHLGSQSSEALAQGSVEYLEERWGSLFGGLPVEIAPGAEEGVYRIRLPAPSLERASTICTAIKSAGGGCYVTSAG